MIERHKMKMLWILLFLVPFSTRICPALPSFSAENESPIFATWDVFEVDKCASIWLIKRFIDPKAKIRIYKKGERIKQGIPFDTPDAKLRRYHNASTYETLLRHYGLKNRRLVALAERCEYQNILDHLKRKLRKRYMLFDDEKRVEIINTKRFQRKFIQPFLKLFSLPLLPDISWPF